jgi:hypothetical protein
MAQSLGAEIKTAYIEVGTRYDIIGKVSGEYLLGELNAQVTKPFIRENFLEAALPYDTSGEVGDILWFSGERANFILMNKTPDSLANEPFEYSAVLYKANVSGELSRPSGEAWNTQTYHKTQVFDIIHSKAYALLTETLFGNELREESYGAITLAQNQLFIPHFYGAQIMDRYSPRSGEHYKVDTINTRQYNGVDVAMLSTDTR